MFQIPSTARLQPDRVCSCVFSHLSLVIVMLGHMSFQSNRRFRFHGESALSQKIKLISTVLSLTHVVQRVQHQSKPFHPLQIVLPLLDIPMSSMNLDAT